MEKSILTDDLSKNYLLFVQDFGEDGAMAYVAEEYMLDEPSVSNYAASLDFKNNIAVDYDGGVMYGMSNDRLAYMLNNELEAKKTLVYGLDIDYYEDGRQLLDSLSDEDKAKIAQGVAENQIDLKLMGQFKNFDWDYAGYGAQIAYRSGTELPRVEVGVCDHGVIDLPVLDPGEKARLAEDVFYHWADSEYFEDKQATVKMYAGTSDEIEMTVDLDYTSIDNLNSLACVIQASYGNDAGKVESILNEVPGMKEYPYQAGAVASVLYAYTAGASGLGLREDPLVAGWWRGAYTGDEVVVLISEDHKKAVKITEEVKKQKPSVDEQASVIEKALVNIYGDEAVEEMKSVNRKL
jgi:hypothetical protein